jgi:hypothetical protein
MIVNLNDIKILHPPCTKNWKLNEKYIPQILSDLQSKETTASPLIDFLAIHALVQDLLDGKPIKFKFFIIPDWPCAEWYSIRSYMTRLLPKLSGTRRKRTYLFSPEKI